MIDSTRIFYDILKQLYAQDNMEEVEQFLIREANKFPSCGSYNEVSVAVMGELGNFYRRTGSFNLAVNWYQKSQYIVLNSLGENTSEYAAITGNLAETYRLAGDYDTAAPLFLQALKICEETALTQTHFYAAALLNLSLLYAAKDDFKTALSYGESALQIFRALSGVSHETAAAYGNLADLYERLGLHEKIFRIPETFRGNSDVFKIAKKPS